MIERTRAQYGPQSTPTFRKNFRMDREVFNQPSVTTKRPPQFQKKSPEQMLENFIKQTRVGTCSHCQKPGHFFKECPGFWQKVQESREAHFSKN